VAVVLEIVLSLAAGSLAFGAGLNRQARAWNRRDAISALVASQKDTDRQLQELGQRLGGLGILAMVDAPEDLGQKVLAEGIYLAEIADDTFRLTVPPDFKPHSFREPPPTPAR